MNTYNSLVFFTIILILKGNKFYNIFSITTFDLLHAFVHIICILCMLWSTSSYDSIDIFTQFLHMDITHSRINKCSIVLAIIWMMGLRWFQCLQCAESKSNIKKQKKKNYWYYDENVKEMQKRSKQKMSEPTNDWNKNSSKQYGVQK